MGFGRRKNIRPIHEQESSNQIDEWKVNRESSLFLGAGRAALMRIGASLGCNRA